MSDRYKPGIHKLGHHLCHVDKILKGGPVAPIHVSIWPTAKCQLNCSYCCCKNVTSRENDLSFRDFQRAVDTLLMYGTKAIEFSGGGEPLLWPFFADAVSYAYSKGLRISLITNGMSLNALSPGIMYKLDWIRVSVTSMAILEHLNLVEILAHTRLSLSCIVNSDESLRLLGKLFPFVSSKELVTRVAVPRPSTDKLIETVSKEVESYGRPFFFSDKEPGAPKGCYMAWVRAAIDWNGNFLPCPSMQLNTTSEGCIPEDFALCHVNDLDRWLTSIEPGDLGYRCEFCNCGKEHNDFIDNLFKISEGVQDADFV